MTETCRTCRFSMMGAQGDPDHGICRRHPPTAQVVDRVVATIWPEVSGEDEDWCGEYQTREAGITVELIDQ